MVKDGCQNKLGLGLVCVFPTLILLREALCD